jgi:hypothetical protein
MQAIARIALSQGETVSSLARRLGGGIDASNIRRHFELNKRGPGVIDLYVEKLGRNDAERYLIREYLDIVDGRFDVPSAREALINDLHAREFSLRDGGLSDLVATIEAIDDATLLPALQAYLRTRGELRLSLSFPASILSTLMVSFVGRKLGLAFAVFADAIREHLVVESFLSPERTPAENCLWLLWAHMQMPDSPFTDDDREAIIATAAGRLLSRGIDSGAMLRYVDRLREHTSARQQPLLERAGLTVQEGWVRTNVTEEY